MSCCGSHKNDKYSSLNETFNESNQTGCCGSNGGGCCRNRTKIELDFNSLSEFEQDFLNKLTSVQYLPLAQFIVKSSIENDFSTVALPIVYIQDKTNSMQEVKATALILKSLEDKGFITLDYDIELENCDYNEYYSSDLFEFFKETVSEGATKENFLGDIAHLNKGSIAPTTDFLLTIDDSDIFTSNLV